MKSTHLACACGKVRLEARGKPIMSTECHCTSCREAGAYFSDLDGSPEFLSPNGGTPYVMMRKDRVEIVSGREHLTAFRISDDRHTGRILATCCNTPAFLEFKGGHWMSIYTSVWPDDAVPPVDLRTMTSDLADPGALDGTVPAGKRQSVKFFAKLLVAWIAMGFRSPEVQVNKQLSMR